MYVDVTVVAAATPGAHGCVAAIAPSTNNSSRAVAGDSFL
jgi:hypothetical protein